MNKYFMEFIGTMFLVLAIGLTGDPIAIGAVLIAMIYAGGHISAAHYNPAVTLAFWLRGRMEVADIPGYLVAQVLGTVVAVFLVGVLGAFSETTQVIDVPQALLAEVLGTFALVFVILNVATAKRTEGNTYFGLAIGLAVVGGAYAFGDVSGAAFNPAVAIGACMMKAFSWGNIWIYMVANFGASALAVFAFKVANPEDH